MLRAGIIFCCLSAFLVSCNSSVHDNSQAIVDSTKTDSVTGAVPAKPVALWTTLSKQDFNRLDTSTVKFKKYRLFALDSAQMQSLLLKSPGQKQFQAKTFSNIIELPRPDSGFMKFSIYSTSVMDSALEAKYPSLKTYGGQGIEDRTAMARLDFNQNGFHAYVISQLGEWIIQPAARGITHQYLICFFKQDALMPNKIPFELPDSLRK